MSKDKSFTFRISEESIESIKEVASKEERSMAQVVRQIIKEWITEKFLKTK